MGLAEQSWKAKNSQTLTLTWDNLAGIFRLQNSLGCWVEVFVLIRTKHLLLLSPPSVTPPQVLILRPLNSKLPAYKSLLSRELKL